MQIFKVRARGYRSSYFLAACRRSRILGCATVICFASCKTRGTKGERGWEIKRKKGEDRVETRGRVDETKERNEWSPSGETGLGDSARKRDHVLDEDREMNSSKHVETKDEGGMLRICLLTYADDIFVRVKKNRFNRDIADRYRVTKSNRFPISKKESLLYRDQK